jgi:hypothetical protein
MNKQFEGRLGRLEQQQEARRRKKPMFPEWLLERWHTRTGLPFDTDEHVRDSLQRMQQPRVSAAIRVGESRRLGPREKGAALANLACPTRASSPIVLSPADVIRPLTTGASRGLHPESHPLDQVAADKATDGMGLPARRLHQVREGSASGLL